MNFDKTQIRQRFGELAQNMLPSGNVVGFFDTVYRDSEWRRKRRAMGRLTAASHLLDLA